MKKVQFETELSGSLKPEDLLGKKVKKPGGGEAGTVTAVSDPVGSKVVVTAEVDDESAEDVIKKAFEKSKRP